MHRSQPHEPVPPQSRYRRGVSHSVYASSLYPIYTDSLATQKEVKARAHGTTRFKYVIVRNAPGFRFRFPGYVSAVIGVWRWEGRKASIYGDPWDCVFVLNEDE